MINIIVGAVLLLMVLGAVAYLVKEKKKGNVCSGCSNAGTCAGKCK